MPKIVIVMPAYNEAKNMPLMVNELFDKVFPEVSANMHLLVVDDFSPDGTGDIVKKLQKKHKNLHLLQKQKEGLGWAYVKGMQYAMNDLKADAVMEMDADFQHPPKFVIPMVQAYLDGAEYVIGSRYVKGGSVPKEWEFSRKAISFFGNLFIRLCLLKLSIHDLTTGFRLTKVQGVLDKIDLEHLMELNRFAFKVDLLYQSLKLSKKTVEVPLEFASRKQEKSKFNYKEMVSTFMVAIILGIRDKKRFIKFAIVGATGFIVNFVFLRVFRNMGLPEVVVWAFATELAIMSNFTLNNIWTFKEKQIGGLVNTVVSFFKFNLTSAGALVIQSIAGPIGVHIVGEQYDFLVLAFIVAFMVLPYNYFMYNFFIWKTWRRKK